MYIEKTKEEKEKNNKIYDGGEKKEQVWKLFILFALFR